MTNELTKIIDELKKAYNERSCLDDYFKAIDKALDEFKKTDYYDPSDVFFKDEKRYNELMTGRREVLDFIAFGGARMEA